jgi:uncharacterized protein (TIGR02246 family)
MNASDEQDIKAVMEATTDLWIRHDMDAWGAYFTDDADFVAHSGLWWPSREANVAGHKDVPASVIDQKRNYKQEVVAVAEVAPDVALVHTRWSWPDFQPLTADAPEPRAGLISYVLVKLAGRWLIRAAQNTRLAA